ncbi:MAG: GNAT family N-acetyltransferase [Bacteroidetes bacterium]|nr:GNAT family N-acetyltransferase [Bacteroidota bacterium]
MIKNLLIGTNIRLRALEPEDIDLLFDMENDTSIWRVSNTNAPFSRFQIEQYVIDAPNDIYANRQLRLMIDFIAPEKQKQTVGAIDLFDFDPFHQRAGIGILIIEPFRDKGIARQAMEILIRYAFTNLGLHQLFCNISMDNEPSVRLFEKLGFMRCGVKKEWLRDGAIRKDEWMFQLLCHED